MKISFDKAVDTKYVSIKKGKIARTEKICNWLFFDLNNKSEVLGVEVLDASKNSLSLCTDGQNLTYYAFESLNDKSENFLIGNLSKFGSEPVVNVVLQYA